MAKGDGVSQVLAKSQRLCDLDDVRGVAQTIQDGKTVSENSGAESAKEDVLQGGFVGTLFAAEETCEDVKAEGHGLEAEEHNDEVDAGGHEHPDDAGDEEEGVEYAFMFLFDLQIFHG